MVQVVWSARALGEVRRITSYIADFSPLAAQRMAVRLRAAGDSLGDFPERGRRVRGSVRELATIRPYVIRYRTERDAVLILIVRHGARRPAP